MIRQKSFDREEAAIYVVATPIGNLNEMTPRAIEVVYNLCDNAIRYNLPGGYVQIETFLTGNRPTLVVKDNGIGISLEDQERIFERFYRVDKSRSKDTGGTGLGLAIVKHVVMRHNGRISVESKIGGPTRIQVIFPSVEEQRKTQQAAQQKEGNAE